MWRGGGGLQIGDLGGQVAKREDGAGQPGLTPTVDPMMMMHAGMVPAIGWQQYAAAPQMPMWYQPTMGNW